MLLGVGWNGTQTYRLIWGRTDLFTVFCLPGCECCVCPVPATSPLECPVFTGDVAGALKAFRVSTGLGVEWATPLKHF